jgi:outer membrane protein
MRTRFCFSFLLALPLAAQAGPEALVDFLAVPGSAGLGAMQRVQSSPYKGAATGYDLVPLYLYEGERVYLHSTRLGLKLFKQPASRFDLLLDYRFEGHPYDETPAILTGMPKRNPSVDLGLGYRHRANWGNLDAEFLHDVGSASHGSELKIGYSYDWQAGRLHLRPSVTVSRRSANLNNYYYGVETEHANLQRPAYLPGAGVDWSLGLYGYYEMTQRWRLLGGVGVNFLDKTVRNSPLVEQRVQPSALVGAAYDFGSHEGYAAPGSPLYVKLMGGMATDCNLLNAMTLRCTSTNTPERTRIFGVALGKPLIERVNNWPLDFVGYVGVLNHDERGFQPDGLQIDASVKVYYYGFPWSSRVRTRLGMGAGVSLAQRVPLVEAQDQARRGRDTSKLLNYLDPSIDVSVGDLIGSRALSETYVGLGVSHRSGIFGASQILGNINGGSNYFYAYLDMKLR